MATQFSMATVTSPYSPMRALLASSMVLQADGKIIVGGSVLADDGFFVRTVFSMARYMPNGALDASFDGNGIVSTDFGNNFFSDKPDTGKSVLLQSDGKVILAGSSGNEFALARYNSNGSLDTSFSSDGKVTSDITPEGDEGIVAVLQSNGKIVLAGRGSGDFILARYNPNGSLDTSFDGDGTVRTDVVSYDEPNSVTVQANGKIVLVGYSGKVLTLIRYNTNGSLDAGFGNAGIVTTDLGNYGEANSVIVQANGKILVGTHRAFNGDYDFSLVRYNSDGSLDESLDGNGIAVTFLDGDQYAYSMAVQADGKIILAGESSNRCAIFRYNTDGSLDTSFGEGGKALSDFGYDKATAKSVKVLADGKILVAGELALDNSYYHDITSFFLARFNPDGSFDKSFNAGNNYMVGNEGNDVLEGGNGKDTLIGGDGNDMLKGGADNDSLDGGLGADTLIGGNGNDLYYVDNTKDKVIEASPNSLQRDAVTTTLNVYTLGKNIEDLYLESENNPTGIGNKLNNIIYANSANNIINGKLGNDTVSYQESTYAVNIDLTITEPQKTGSSGSDTLISIENVIGSDSDDVLNGNAAINILTGGEGNDTLTGGKGKDTFVLGTQFSVLTVVLYEEDTITDFKPIDDTINLDRTVFTKLALGSLKANNFKVDPQHTDSDDYITYYKSSGIVYYDADGSGEGKAQEIAILAENLPLSSADFFVF